MGLGWTHSEVDKESRGIAKMLENKLYYRVAWDRHEWTGSKEAFVRV